MRLVLWIASLVPIAAQAAPAKSDFSPSEVRSLTAKYADCVVGERGPLAWRIMRDNPGNEVIIKRYPAILIPSCIAEIKPWGLDMRFPGDIYVNALAEALFRKFLTGVSLKDLASVPALTHRPFPVIDEAKLPKNRRLAEVARERFNNTLGTAYLSRFGECVARQTPDGAKDLLSSAMDSEAEKAAFSRLQSALGKCLSSGTQLKFGKSVLRGAIAMNYVRLADAAYPDRFPMTAVR